MDDEDIDLVAPHPLRVALGALACATAALVLHVAAEFALAIAPGSPALEALVCFAGLLCMFLGYGLAGALGARLYAAPGRSRVLPAFTCAFAGAVVSTLIVFRFPLARGELFQRSLMLRMLLNLGPRTLVIGASILVVSWVLSRCLQKRSAARR